MVAIVSKDGKKYQQIWGVNVGKKNEARGSSCPKVNG
jgi:hypothetical protein